jgi:hypothetical protein
MRTPRQIRTEGVICELVRISIGRSLASTLGTTRLEATIAVRKRLFFETKLHFIGPVRNKVGMERIAIRLRNTPALG